MEIAYNFFVKGLMIAVIFGVPAGAIGALTIQRTLEKGFFYGFFTGMGSTAAELIYASISVFGITFISDFLLQYKIPIRIIGSILIFIYGILVLKKKGQSENTTIKEDDKTNILSSFLSSFIVAVMNPAMLLSYAVAFTTVGISGKVNLVQGIWLMMGVFIGTTIWWLLISGTVAKLKKKITGKIYRILNCSFGVLLIIFALAMAVSVFAGSDADDMPSIGDSSADVMIASKEDVAEKEPLSIQMLLGVYQTWPHQ